jgi:glucokinase
VILACDVGGTKTNVALLEPAGSSLAIARFESFRSRDHATLDDILVAFAGGHALSLDAAGFGVAGPVIGGRAVTTNLPWEIDARRLAERLGLPAASLLNDVEAHAWSVDRLAPTALLTLQEGAPADGTVAVIAAGTGIGFSALVGSGTSRVSMASEGGHADFAARSPLEGGLLAFLRDRHGQVSVERVLSGPGLVNVYEFLREAGGGEEPPWLSAALREGDPAAAISAAAMGGRSETCSRAVDLFLEAYGAEAGNWALRTLAAGGLYVGGGIARKLLGPAGGAPEAWRARARETFLRGFHDKERMRSLLESVPVRVILDERAPLVGAARFAIESATWQAAR